MNCLESLTSRKSKAFKQFHQETFPAIAQHERRPTPTDRQQEFYTHRVPKLIEMSVELDKLNIGMKIVNMMTSSEGAGSDLCKVTLLIMKIINIDLRSHLHRRIYGFVIQDIPCPRTDEGKFTSAAVFPSLPTLLPAECFYDQESQT